MTDYTFPLDSNQLTLDSAGGKGANLRRLLAGGFPVPPGFVVATGAYRRFVAANDLQPLIQEQVGAVRADDATSFQAASRAIRDAFDRGVMPADVEAAVVAAHNLLGAPAVAVRSSATAEDLPDASFAGQQDTFLNVVGAEEVLGAVVRCWSSLWTARAMSYRARQEIAPDQVALAVIVQQMVFAESAGVLFTVNPVNGDAGEMMINATWGLGEALVSGEVNPDTFVVESQSGRLLETTLGDKKVMTTPVADGTREREVDVARRRELALTAAQVSELVSLGRSIAGYFGAPQDVEWALAGGSFAILQTRPVTTEAPPVGAPGDDDWPPLEIESRSFDLWTQADVGERWPEPVTPLTWSTAHPMLNDNIQTTFAGVDPGVLDEIEWARRAYGRVYFNEGAMVHLFNQFYGMPASSIAASLAAPQLAPPEKDRWRWGTLLRRAPLLLRLIRDWDRDAERFEADFPLIDRWVDDFMARDLSRMGDEALWTESHAIWYERLYHYLDYHAEVTGAAMNAFSPVKSLVESADAREGLVYELLAGLSDVIAAEIVPMLWDITAELEEAGLASVVLENEPHEALSKLRTLDKAAPALAMLDAFLQRHGHRCMTEAEWLHPRWIEEPAAVMEMVDAYLRAGDEHSPVAVEARQKERRLEQTALVEAALDPIRRAYFRRMLSRLQRLMRLRDNGQHYAVKLLLPIRHIYATLGRRWAERGWLPAAEDFFFLVVPEIEAVLAAGGPEGTDLELPAIVRARREAYEYWFTQPMPEVLDARGEPVAAAAPDSAGVLAGLPASSGQVQGVARVVHSPAEAASLQAGDILVTRSTDPGWTPVFSVIGGLVLEIGGQLSHGAIVAREYGLPAVVNVPEATQRIESGMRITVDGGNGRVYLESSERE